MSFAEKELNRKSRGVVSAIVGINSNEQIEGQENIETLENGKYLPTAKQEKNNKSPGRPPVEREVKKRISLAVFPSVYDDIGKIAYVERKSISGVIGKCLEEYIEKNQDKIKEYDRLKK